MSNPLYPNGITGLADSKHSGPAGSVYRMVGVDVRQTPGIIKAQQALVKDSSTTVDELCNDALKASDSSTLWFSSESGKVWREVSGTYTLVYTTVPTSGSAACTGAAEYDGNIYWATTAYVHKVPVAGLGGDWSNVVNPNWGEFKNGTDIHPMQVANLKLLIADGTDIAVVETPDIDGTPASDGTVAFGTAVYGGLIGTFVQPPTGATLFPNLVDSWSAYSASASSLTKEITVPPGYNRALIAIVWSWRTDGTTPAAATGVTFNGDAMSSIGSGSAVVGTNQRIRREFYKLVAPDIATGDVVVTWAGAETNRLVQIFAFDNVNQTTPLDDVYAVYTTAGGGTVTSLGFTAGGTPVDITGHDYCTLLMSSYSQDATHLQSGTELINVDEGSFVHSASVSTVGGGFFQDSSPFWLRAPERITSLIDFDIDVLVGTQNVNKARVLRWDTVNASWSAEDTVDEAGVNAFIRDDNFVYASIGTHGRLYYYDGEKMQPHKRLPGDWSPTLTATIKPSSVGFLLGVPVFGVSNVAGNPTLQGVYGFGSYSTDYPKILSLDFPTPNTTFAGLSVGAIVTDGADMWVAYKDATVVGVAKLSYTTKYDGAYIETRMLIGPKERSDLSTISRYFVDCVSMLGSTDVAIAIKTAYDATYTALTTKRDTTRLQIRADASTPRIANLQVKYTLTCNGNYSPEIENLAIE